MKTEITRYDFCVFRLPPNTGRAVWEITNRCNYPCDYCDFTKCRTPIRDELTTLEVFQALDGLKEKGFSHIKFTGGEPFLRQDMMQILERSNELGFIVDISTNASRITTEKARALAGLKLSMVHSSIDGHNQATHESVRGPNTYYPTIYGVKNLVDCEIYVRIGSLIHTGNENHLDKMVESIAGFGVNEVIFSYMEPGGKMKLDDPRVTKTPAEVLRPQIEELAAQYAGKIKVNHSLTQAQSPGGEGICPGGSKLLFIDNIGRIAPCSWMIQSRPQYRSDLTLKQRSLAELMETGPVKDYLDEVERSRTQGHYGCLMRKR